MILGYLPIIPEHLPLIPGYFPIIPKRPVNMATKSLPYSLVCIISAIVSLRFRVSWGTLLLSPGLNLSDIDHTQGPLVDCGFEGAGKGVGGINSGNAVDTGLDCGSANLKAVTGLIAMALGRDIDDKVDLMS
jgi:hypothetical protein